jgi:DNA-binding transcriptional LysR family regulator
MARREPSWDELRTFFEVLRDGSLSGAARRLGLTQPTVGRHVDALEEALGVTLFTRSPRGLAPTPAAIALAPHGEAMAPQLRLCRALHHRKRPLTKGWFA